MVPVFAAVKAVNSANVPHKAHNASVVQNRGVSPELR